MTFENDTNDMLACLLFLYLLFYYYLPPFFFFCANHAGMFVVKFVFPAEMGGLSGGLIR